MKVKAVFKGGPIHGQEVELPDHFVEVDVSESVKGMGQIKIGLSGNVPANYEDGREVRLVIGRTLDALDLPVPRTRYVLHFTDRKGVAHYYVPTSSSAPISRK